MALEKMSVLKTEDGKEFEIVDAAARKQIQSISENGTYKICSGLKVEDGVLSVDVAEAVTENDHRPISSAAVHVTVGNIDALLKII